LAYIAYLIAVAPIHSAGYRNTMRRAMLSAGLVLVLLMVLQRPAQSALDPPPVAVDDFANVTITKSVLVNVTKNDEPPTVKLTAVSTAVTSDGTEIGTVEIKDGQILYTPYTKPTPPELPAPPATGTIVFITYTITDPATNLTDTTGLLTITLRSPCTVLTNNLPCVSQTGNAVYRCANPSYCQTSNAVVRANLRCQYNYRPLGAFCTGANKRDGFCLGTSSYCITPRARPFRG